MEVAHPQIFRAFPSPHPTTVDFAYAGVYASDMPYPRSGQTAPVHWGLTYWLGEGFTARAVAIKQYCHGVGALLFRPNG